MRLFSSIYSVDRFRGILPGIGIIAIKTVAIIQIVAVTAISIFATTYAGTNTGAIPDGGTPTPTCGLPLDVAFAVSGFPGSAGSVSVNFSTAPQHSFIGDLQVTLFAPNGVNHLLFSRVGANTATDFGDNANLDGTYTFTDLASLNIWSAAAATASTNLDIPSGSYRTQAAGPFATDSPGPAFTSMNPVFAAVPPANVNGTWTLRFLDCSAGDTGTVTAANLTLNPLLAGSATIGGRVTTASGAGIRGTTVMIEGGDLTQPRTVSTGTFGYYSFAGLAAGQTYILTIHSKRFTFENPTVLVSLDQDLADVNFVASEE